MISMGYGSNTFRRRKSNARYFSESECLIGLRRKTLELLGEKCVRCGFSDWRALQVDHVDGFPGEERLRRYKLYEDIRKCLRLGIKKYQCLCANCNWIKRYENNEHSTKKVPANLSSGESVHKMNTILS